MATRSKNELLRPDLAGYSATEGILAEVRLAAASLARFSGEDGAFQMHGVPYLFVGLEGSRSIVLPDGEHVRLSPGDSILSLKGDPVSFGQPGGDQRYTDIIDVWRQNAAPPASSEGYEAPVEIVWGNSANRCRLLGSSMVLSRTTQSLPLVRNAPSALVIPASETRLDLMVNGFDKMLDDECRNARRGFPAQSKAIAHFILIQILRSYMTHHVPINCDLVATHRTRGVTRLLKALRNDPEREWTMTDMARAAGMSRTSFFDHFCRISGTTPFKHLADLRVDTAARLLKNSDENVAEIANQVGYKSTTAFVVAFKNRYGQTPSYFRKTHRIVVENPDTSKVPFRDEAKDLS